jgi:hypothetical protein
MSLHASLSINAISIGSLYAMCQESRDLSAPGIDDTVNTYDVVVDYADERRLPWTGMVRHRYGDGGWELVRAVLDAMHDEQES